MIFADDQWLEKKMYVITFHDPSSANLITPTIFHVWHKIMLHLPVKENLILSAANSNTVIFF